jgi:hypothetical protein
VPAETLAIGYRIVRAALEGWANQGLTEAWLHLA